MSVDVLDEKGEAVGLTRLPPGTSVTILKEDAEHVYFEDGRKSFRLQKAKIEPPK
jgi:hypothetical protein